MASLLTGAYPHTTKVRSLADPLAPEIVSVAELFRAKGYRTVAVVSNHVLRPRRGLGRGFEIYDYAGDARDGAAKRVANEEEKRKRLASGELGLDLYQMRDRLVAEGLVYVDSADDLE